MTRSDQISVDDVTRKMTVDQLLDDLGWGALLVTTGTLWLLPEGYLPRGSWLMAVGLILLAFNAARHTLRIRMNGLALVVGLLALITGAGAYLNVNLPLFPIALIVVGACWLLVSESEDCSVASRSQCRHCGE